MKTSRNQISNIASWKALPSRSTTTASGNSSCLQGHFKIWDVTNGELMAEIHRNNYFDMQRKEGQRSPTGPVLIKGKPSNTNITRMQEIYPEQYPTSFAYRLKKKLQFNFTSPNKAKNRNPARIRPSLTLLHST